MMYVDLGLAVRRHSPETATDEEADARIRTADPFITSEVLYQLSYVGRVFRLAASAATHGTISSASGPAHASC